MLTFWLIRMNILCKDTMDLYKKKYPPKHVRIRATHRVRRLATVVMDYYAIQSFDEAVSAIIILVSCINTGYALWD